MQTLAPGLSGQRSLIVEERHTAGHLGSGGASVYATPMMVLAMEEAALSVVDPLLEPGKATVGYSLDIKHLAATPIGMRVTATATLLSIEGKMLTFHVEARDERELIGEGTHIRAIIDLERFRARLATKSLPAS